MESLNHEAVSLRIGTYYEGKAWREYYLISLLGKWTQCSICGK